jgi:GTPase SAR1 family protein
MNVTKEALVNHFGSRYLKISFTKDLKSIADVLDLEIIAFKTAEESETKILKEQGLKTIRDLGKITSAQLELIQKTTQIDVHKLELFSIASKLIKRSWMKRSEYSPKETTKICVVGLDNAGKSTLISLLHKEPLSKAVNQDPTKDISHIKIDLEDAETVLWDFAGQKHLRDNYLQEPERYFLHIGALVFVFDVQDQDRYDEAIGYFEEILKILEFLGEKTYILFLLHKHDPELRENSDIEIGVNYLKQELAERMKSHTYQYEMITSSIYSTFQENPEVVKKLKDLFKAEKENPNLLLIDVMVKLTENLFIIAENIMGGQQKIIEHINELKPPQLYKGGPGDLGLGFPELEQIPKPSQILEISQNNEGEAPTLLEELKSMFETINKDDA